MRAGWGEGVRPSRKNEQKGTFQPGMKTPTSTKSRAAQCILESYVALLMRRCIAQMEKLSRKIIFQRAPHTNRRKRLSAKALGTN